MKCTVRMLVMPLHVSLKYITRVTSKTQDVEVLKQLRVSRVLGTLRSRDYDSTGAVATWAFPHLIPVYMKAQLCTEASASGVDLTNNMLTNMGYKYRATTTVINMLMLNIVDMKLLLPAF